MCVTRSNFRTCNDTAFCKRQRYQSTKAHETYQIPFDSIVTDRYNIKANLALFDTSKDKETSSKPLKLELSFYENDIVHLHIFEHDPLHPRYEVEDIIQPESLIPATNAQMAIFENENKISITFGENMEKRVEIFTKPHPFELRLYFNDEMTMSVNSENLLKFEIYREKEIKVTSQKYGKKILENLKNAFKMNELKEDIKIASKDREDMWKESFGKFKDVIKYGPSSIGIDIQFINTKNLYGIPEHASSFSLKDTKYTTTGYNEPFRLYNLDVTEYELDNPMALYGSVPLMISHNAKQTVGLLWLNAAETFIDIYTNKDGNSRTSHWMSETGNIDMFLLTGPTPQRVSFQYAKLTGFLNFPPRFSIAYHQCRWNYMSSEDVLNVNRKFDEFNIPVDTIWLDIEHTDGRRYFTWDEYAFPHPKMMQDKLATMKRKMVAIVDPHIKVDQNYYVYSEAKKNDLFVKKSDNKTFEGKCWAGRASYIDFFNPKAREYWASLYSFDRYKGSTKNLFIWNDMNEPSVFGGPELSMEKSAIHNGKWEHREVHNLYGHLMHKSTYKGLLLRSDNKERPFILTRSFFAGSQRYSAVWTGDNNADWDHLRISTSMLLTLGITGMSFSGSDVGGFFGNPNEELLLRWYQAASFHPFFRAHAEMGSRRREPYLFAKKWVDLLRKAIQSRYTHLDYIYTIFHESSVTGKPILRPLWYEYPKDRDTFSIEDSFLVGKDILVHPITNPKQINAKIYFPNGDDWIEIESFEEYKGGLVFTIGTSIDKIPVFQRSGSIIPRKLLARQSSELMVDDPYTLIVALDGNNEAIGELYNDDGHSFEYKNGKYFHRKFTFKNNLLSSVSIHSSDFVTKSLIERINIIGLKSEIKHVRISSESISSTDLEFKQDSNLVISLKKLNVKIDKDFTVEFV